MILRLFVYFPFSLERKKEKQVLPLTSHQFESLEICGDILNETPDEEEESNTCTDNFRSPELLFHSDDCRSIHLFYYNQINYATVIGKQQSAVRSLSIQKSNKKISV
jgi:hypothetical protein